GAHACEPRCPVTGLGDHGVAGQLQQAPCRGPKCRVVVDHDRPFCHVPMVTPASAVGEGASLGRVLGGSPEPNHPFCMKHPCGRPPTVEAVVRTRTAAFFGVLVALLIPGCGGGGGEHAAISTGVTATLPTATRTT